MSETHEPHEPREPSATTTNFQGEALLDRLKGGHWFWDGTDPQLPEEREEAGVPPGMVDPSSFLNFNTGESRNFLAELERDGIELIFTPDAPDRPLMDRVTFMEWLILRYVTQAAVYDSDELESFAAKEVEEARAQWESDAEDASDEHTEQLERAGMESQAARSGWIYLDEIAQHTGVDPEHLFRIFGERYTIALAPGGERWIAKWFDAFDWLQDHFASQWEPDSEGARSAVAELVRSGVSDHVALDKARRAFINEKAAVPISMAVGIHTLADRACVHEGYRVIGFDAAGETISVVDEYSWEPHTDRESEWGFPIRGEGPNY